MTEQHFGISPELSDGLLEDDECKDHVELGEQRGEMKHFKTIHAAHLQPSQTDAKSKTMLF